MLPIRSLFPLRHLAPSCAAVVLCTCTFFSLGCQPKGNAATHAANATVSKEFHLSKDAQSLYYHLLLTEATTDQNREAALAAIKGLVSIDGSLPMYQSAGSILFSYGMHDEAVKLMEEGVKHYPDDVTVTQMLSASYSESGQSAKAIPLLQNFLKKHPRATAITLELVRLYLRNGQVAQARLLLPELPPHFSPQAAYLHARVLEDAKQFDKAKKILLDQSRRTPGDPDAWVELALLSEKENNIPEAIRYYKQAIALTPQNYELVFRAVGLMVKQKDILEVETVLQATQAPTELVAQIAMMLNAQGNSAEAEKLLTEELSKGADPALINYYLSIAVLQDDKDIPRALDYLRNIPKNNPAYVHALERTIRLYLYKEDYKAALQAVEAGKKEFPDNPVFWELHAYSLASLGKPDEALVLLRGLQKKYPGNQDMLFLLASIEDEYGSKQKALEIMENIIAQNPRNAKALNYIGYTLADENRDLDRALRLLQTAVEEAPDAPYVVDSMAWVLFRLQRYEEAWKYIQRCVDLGGNEAAIWEHYGDIAEALKKTGEAIKGYSEAMKGKPDNAETLNKKLSALQKK